MDFKITQFLVVPVGNALPTTGKSLALTAGQVGIYKQDYAPATSGNAAAATWIQICQGRTVPEPSLAPIKTGKIYRTKVLSLTRSIGSATAANQITDIGGFTDSIHCGETLSITLRLMSNYIKVGFANGLTRTVTVQAPCCDCGDEPCVALDAAAIQTLVDQFVVAINTEARLKDFVIAERFGTGASSAVRVIGKPLTVYGPRTTPGTFVYEYDRLLFWAYAYKGPELTSDYIVADRCEQFATVTVQQRSSYPSGASGWIKKMEDDYRSYNTIYGKHLYLDTDFNNVYSTNVVDGTTYDLVTIDYMQGDEPMGFEHATDQVHRITLAFPTGTSAATVTILQNFTGLTVLDEGAAGTTTSSTSTSSTSSSTSTSTTMIP